MSVSTEPVSLNDPWRSAPVEVGRSRFEAWARGATLERIALLGLLTGTALLFIWNLGASGWANAYYSAAVQAGSQDWLAMLFGSFDAGNAITVDKTPASLWVMSLSARVFGFSAWSVLVPQAVEGVLAVWLLYLTVGRRFGASAGLLAGAVLALTPVATLMFRFNNPDALLTLLLVASAYATVRALEGASTRWLVLAGAAIGFAYLTKMLQGFIVIPTFAAVYLLAAPTTLRRRVWQVGAAAVSVLVSAGWWVALVMLWPEASRPYIGGSQTNSIIELMLGYNGIGRLTGDEVGRVGGGGGAFSEGNGLFRLFGGELAGQVSWLLPVALIALLALLWVRRRNPRTDTARAQVLLWGGWLVTTGLVFSLMQGIFHAYYLVVLVPAIGALVGIGAAYAWRHRRLPVVRACMAGTLVVSGAWAAVVLGHSPSFHPWLAPAVLTGSFLAAGAVLVLGDAPSLPLRAAVIAASLAALLAAPAVASVATAAEPHTGSIPTAAPTSQAMDRFGGNGGLGPAGGFGGGLPILPNGGLPGTGAFAGRPGQLPMGGFPGQRGAGGIAGGGLGGLLDAAATDPELVAALKADASAYRWVAATTGANNAAGLALSSGESVMGIGGFNGSDPSPGLAEFQAYVDAGEIHYYVAGADAAGFRGTQGGSAAAAQISAWVDANFEATTIGGVTVYDLTASS